MLLLVALSCTACSYAAIAWLNSRLPPCLSAWTYYQMEASETEIEAWRREAYDYRHRKLVVLFVDHVYVAFYSISYLSLLCSSPLPVRVIACGPGASDAVETAVFALLIYRPAIVPRVFRLFRFVNRVKYASTIFVLLLVLMRVASVRSSPPACLAL